jgi:hypothetical protein
MFREEAKIYQKSNIKYQNYAVLTASRHYNLKVRDILKIKNFIPTLNLIQGIRD